MNYQKNQIEKIGIIKSIQLRNEQGEQTHWINPTLKQLKGIQAALEDPEFNNFNILEEHQGSRNIFTFLAYMDIFNDDNNQNYFVEYGRECLALQPTREDAALKVHERMQEYFEEGNQLSGSNSVHSSLLFHAIAFIDMREISFQIIEAAEERNQQEQPV